MGSQNPGFPIQKQTPELTVFKRWQFDEKIGISKVSSLQIWQASLDGSAPRRLILPVDS